MVQFTDSEINVIYAVMKKADPMGLLEEAQSIITKIRTYADEKKAQETQAATEAPVAD